MEKTCSNENCENTDKEEYLDRDGLCSECVYREYKI